jgi:hypothetical protein
MRLRLIVSRLATLTNMRKRLRAGEFDREVMNK